MLGRILAVTNLLLCLSDRLTAWGLGGEGGGGGAGEGATQK